MKDSAQWIQFCPRDMLDGFDVYSWFSWAFKLWITHSLDFFLCWFLFCVFRIAVSFANFLFRHRQGTGHSVERQSQRGNTTIKTCISLEFYTQFSLPYLFYFQWVQSHLVSRSHYLHASLLVDRLWSKTKLW